MLGLPNPWVLIGLAVAAFGAGHHWATMAQEAEVARLNAIARETEHQLATQAAAAAQELTKANHEAETQISQLRSDVQSGAVRLSIAARSLQTATAAGATAGAGPAPRCDIDPTAAQDLISIAADGDAAIRQLNALITLYQQLKETHNADR